jgi:hypothetical protein
VAVRSNDVTAAFFLLCQGGADACTKEATAFKAVANFFADQANAFAMITDPTLILEYGFAALPDGPRVVRWRVADDVAIYPVSCPIDPTTHSDIDPSDPTELNLLNIFHVVPTNPTDVTDTI